MKILLTTPFDFTYPGGVNEHVLQLDYQLRAFGHETRILAPRSEDEPEIDDGHYYKLGTAIPIPVNGSTARITLSPFLSGKVKGFLQREQFDIIHLHEPLTPTLPLMVLLHSQSVNIGTFHASHSSYFGYNLGYLYGKPILSYFFNKLHTRIAVSQSAKKFINHYFNDGYRIIPNGIDYDRFGSATDYITPNGDPSKTILFVGRYNESRKGFKYLIRAMKHVQDVYPDCRLRVVGPGTPDRFMHDIDRYSVRNVEFVGPVSAERLPSYYAECDVFCAPSTGRESFGIVLLEGMASGKPVVASDISGYRAVVRNDVEGLLVEPKRPDQLAKALIRTLSDHQLSERLAEAGRVRAQEFSWPVVARRVVDCYESASNRVRQAQTLPPNRTSVFSTRWP